jgi:hypothetical protein
MNDNKEEFVIINNERNLRYKIARFLFVSGAILGLIGCLLLNVFFIIFQILILYFVFTSILWILNNLFLKNYTEIGQLVFIDTTVMVNVYNNYRTYNLLDLSKIKVGYYGSDGDSFNTIVVGSLLTKDGTHNYFGFEENDGTKHKYEFLVKDDRILKQLLLKWDRENIPYELKNLSK